jgi:hypothetical protein
MISISSVRESRLQTVGVTAGGHGNAGFFNRGVK